MSTSQTSSATIRPTAQAGLRYWRIVASLLIVFVGAAAALVRPRDATANQTIDPAYTHSWYINNLSVDAMYQLAQTDGSWDADPNHCQSADNSSRDKVIVLDWGKSYNLTGYGSPYNGYGTLLPKHTDAASQVTDATIVYLTEQYADSYFWASGGPGGCSQTRIAIGVNNSFLCVNSPSGQCNPYDAGAEWSAAVTDIENWLQARGLTSRVNIRAAADFETYGDSDGQGWQCANVSRPFMDGFADQGYNAILDFGDAWTSSGCWSAQDVYYILAGRPNFFGLPEIYNSGQLCTFTTGCYSGIERDVAPVAFKGQMTQCTGPDVLPHADCPNTAGGNWAPYQSWNALWNTQQQSFPGVQTTMPFSTNIRDQ